MIDIKDAINDLNHNIDFIQSVGGEQFMATPGEIVILLTALQSENGELRSALARVEAERDAAITDVAHDCEHCKHATGNGACKLLPDGDQFSPDYTDGFDRDGNCDHWKWRGAQREW